MGALLLGLELNKCWILSLSFGNLMNLSLSYCQSSVYHNSFIFCLFFSFHSFIFLFFLYPLLSLFFYRSGVTTKSLTNNYLRKSKREEKKDIPLGVAWDSFGAGKIGTPLPRIRRPIFIICGLED